MKKDIDNTNENGKLKIVLKILAIVGIFVLCVAAFFWVVLFLKRKCGSDIYSAYYYLSIVAATIAFGIFTVYFSIYQKVNNDTKVGNEQRQRTNEIYSEFQKIQRDLPTKVINACVEGIVNEHVYKSMLHEFVNNSEDYRDFYKATLEGLASPNTVYDWLAEKIKDSVLYNNLQIGLNAQNNKYDFLDYFLNNGEDVLRKYESLCTNYLNQMITEAFFENQILPTIAKTYLVAYLIPFNTFSANKFELISNSILNFYKIM